MAIRSSSSSSRSRRRSQQLQKLRQLNEADKKSSSSSGTSSGSSRSGGSRSPTSADRVDRSDRVRTAATTGSSTSTRAPVRMNGTTQSVQGVTGSSPGATAQPRRGLSGEGAPTASSPDTILRQRAAEARTTAGESQQAATEKNDAARAAQDELARAQRMAGESGVPQAVRDDYREQIPGLETAADRAQSSADRANQQALQDQQQANQKAEAAGQEPPYPAAQDVDASGSPAEVTERVARMDGAQQEALLGTRSSLTTEQVAARDAARIADATEEGPQQGAEALERAVTSPGASDEYKQALLEEARPSIEAIGGQLEGIDRDEAKAEATMGALARTGEALGPEGARTLADGVAKNMAADDLDHLDNSIKESVKNGDGTTFGVQLSEALSDAGKPQAAEAIAADVARGVNHLREDFQSKADAADSADEALGYQLATQGPNLTDDQRQAMVDGHLEDHQSTYDDRDAAGAKLATALDGLEGVFDEGSINASDAPGGVRDLRSASVKALNELPRLAETPAGAEKIGDALTRSGQGEATFLDHVRHSTSKADNPDELRAQMTSAMTRAGSAQAMSLAAQGRGDEIPALGRGMSTNAERLGTLTSQGAQDMRDRFDAFPDGGDNQALEDWAGGFKDALSKPHTFANMTPAYRNALESDFKTFGTYFGAARTAAGAAAFAAGVGSFNEQDVLGKAQTIAQGMDLGVDAATSAVKIGNIYNRFEGVKDPLLGNSGAASRLGRVGALKLGGAVLGGVTAALDGVNAYRSFQEGDALRGTGHAISALGGAAVAVTGIGAAITGTTGWTGVGAVVGGATALVGLGIGHFANVRDANKNEGPTEQALTNAGFDPDIAKELSNHDGDGRSAGPVLNQVASRFGMDGPQFYEWLNQQDPGQVKDIVEAAHGVDPNGDGVYELGDPDGPVTRNGGRNGLVTLRPDSINGLANWMQHVGLAPGPITNTSAYTGSSFENDGGG